MNSVRKVDIAIIGAGSAGMRAYRAASKYTDAIVLIEGGSYGTTCARVGCMPSKLLIAAAESAHVPENAAQMGVHFNTPRIDGKEVMQRVKSERDRFVGFVQEDVLEWPEAHRIRGYAQFLSDHRLQVSHIDGNLLIDAEKIIIATGSRPFVPESLRALGHRALINDDVFEWDDLPASVAVIGAGVIGLELGQALHRLGVRTALFSRRKAVGGISDPEVLDKAVELVSASMPFYDEYQDMETRLVENGVELSFSLEHDGRKVNKKETFQYVLATTGRVPNVDHLGLENTSIETDERGVPIADIHTGRVGESHIFIAGDANNEIPLLHEAADEGQIAGYNAAHYPDVRRFKKSAPISVVFSDPQIMMIGKSYAELVRSNMTFRVGDVDWQGQGRARVMLVNKGLLRVYGECNTGRFLGAEMIGPRAENIAHLLAWSYQSNLTVAEMLERPFYHPVLEEGVRTALRKLNFALQMGPQPPARCIDCGPGA